MTMELETVSFEARDGVAWVTLNRPRVHNALDLQMRDDLWSVLDAIEVDAEVRVVVFRGAGERSFSSGADISEFGTSPSYEAARRARLGRDLWGRMKRFEKPLVAAIQGYALGAGCELSLLCDIRIASEDARLGLPETSLGYIPTAGGTQTLPRTISRGRALDMVLSADPISAQQALECGLVQRVVPRERLYQEAESIALRLVGQSQTALRLAKRTLVEGQDLSLADGLRLEARLTALLTVKPVHNSP